MSGTRRDGWIDGWMCAVSLSAALLKRRSSLLVSFAADSAPLHSHWSNETRPKSIDVTRNETRLFVSVFAYETDLLSVLQKPVILGRT